MAKVTLTTPVGRIVAGSLYNPNVKDFDGNPLVVKTGANKGQARSDYFFAIAIAKGGEQHWSQASYTNNKGALIEWGKEILTVGYSAFPQAYQTPAFAWKIEDGDSAIPNKRNKKPCDNEGWRGHWILKMSGGFAPKIYRYENGALVQELTEGFVKPGYFVQVNLDVRGNDNSNNPGIYLNHSLVCMIGFGAEIVFGPSVEEAGFGAVALPAGASAVPLASANPMPAAVPTAPSATVAAPVPSAPALTPPVPVTPNTQFLQVPVAPGAPSPVVAVPSVPVVPTPPSVTSPSKVMTAKAGGASYESFIAGGWDDARMIAEGYLSL